MVLHLERGQALPNLRLSELEWCQGDLTADDL